MTQKIELLTCSCRQMAYRCDRCLKVDLDSVADKVEAGTHLWVVVPWRSNPKKYFTDQGVYFSADRADAVRYASMLQFGEPIKPPATTYAVVLLRVQADPAKRLVLGDDGEYYSETAAPEEEK